MRSKRSRCAWYSQPRRTDVAPYWICVLWCWTPTCSGPSGGRSRRAQIVGQPAIHVLFSAQQTASRDAGFLAMGGQIIGAMW
ncbi:hypothetical protein MOX02_57370 [Methylobacterium oxalidis]|uniref:Uncharacterized protein n=1 Tax=Methylobacterium oxalidis TaxID=944322 RepID=A0A512JCQ6_9HYPH|nr:hypothetical protein MOX02_57370 [Methylobacterium oxalidis]